jgi:hypothetical protein
MRAKRCLFEERTNATVELFLQYDNDLGLRLIGKERSLPHSIPHSRYNSVCLIAKYMSPCVYIGRVRVFQEKLDSGSKSFVMFVMLEETFKSLLFMLCTFYFQNDK